MQLWNGVPSIEWSIIIDWSNQGNPSKRYWLTWRESLRISLYDDEDIKLSISIELWLQEPSQKNGSFEMIFG